MKSLALIGDTRPEFGPARLAEPGPNLVSRNNCSTYCCARHCNKMLRPQSLFEMPESGRGAPIYQVRLGEFNRGRISEVRIFILGMWGGNFFGSPQEGVVESG